VLARKLIRARRALGWSHAELARRAGVRVETLNRLEHGRHSPNVATVDKIDRALKAGEADRCGLADTSRDPAHGDCGDGHGCGLENTVCASTFRETASLWTRLVTGASSMSKAATRGKPPAVQRVRRNGRRMVMLEESEYERLRRKADEGEPLMPEPLPSGNYPAAEALAVVQASTILRARRELGLSQAELARRAGIRPETLNRIEQGRNQPSIPTIAKLERALKAGEAQAGRGKRKVTKVK
jgi:transcriptional regulator with XRE-family HTH domain